MGQNTVRARRHTLKGRPLKGNQPTPDDTAKVQKQSEWSKSGQGQDRKRSGCGELYNL